MAIFERREKIQPLDDTQVVNCVIEGAQDVNGHTEYLLRLQRGPLQENNWKILRRYNDFVKLNEHLRISNIFLPMPGKKLIGKMRPEFVAERRRALQEYINNVLMNPILASSLPTKRFVDPESYSQSFHDQAVQNASLCLRISGIYSLGPTLGPIGWRIRKHYFKVLPKAEKSGSKLLVRSSQAQRIKHAFVSGCNLDLPDRSVDPSEIMLEWVEFGPDKYIDDKNLADIFKSLMSLEHKNIENIIYTSQNENGCLILRRFYKQGTLKDVICMTSPKNPFLSKYGNPRGRSALPMEKLRYYGRQILEALLFLHSKGFPYGHLHSGNVVIADDCVKLLDIENYILGVPAFYRPFFVQHSKIHTVESIDVYSFGHVLFEMAMGYPLQESIAHQISGCPDELKYLLESILSKEACKAGLPSLEELIKHPFFKLMASSEGSSKSHLRMSWNAKEAIRLAVLKFESRLRDEQKSIKNQKRIVRVQEFMSSEEERRKAKQKAKLGHKYSKLKQVSLQVNNERGEAGSGSEEVATANSTKCNLKDNVCINNLSKNNPEQGNHLISSSQQENGANRLLKTSCEIMSSSPNISVEHQAETSRSTLLESICKFNRGSLRKVRSKD